MPESKSNGAFRIIHRSMYKSAVGGASRDLFTLPANVEVKISQVQTSVLRSILYAIFCGFLCMENSINKIQFLHNFYTALYATNTHKRISCSSFFFF